MTECRICYDNSGPMISPCLCNGTIKYVHVECLNKFRLIDKIGYVKCKACNYTYNIGKNNIVSKICNFIRVNIKKIVTILSVLLGICIGLILNQFMDAIYNNIDQDMYIRNLIVNYRYIICPVVLYCGVDFQLKNSNFSTLKKIIIVMTYYILSEIINTFYVTLYLKNRMILWACIFLYIIGFITLYGLKVNPMTHIALYLVSFDNKCALILNNMLIYVSSLNHNIVVENINRTPQR